MGGILLLALLPFLAACGQQASIRGEPRNPLISFPYYRVLEVLDGKTILLEPPGGPEERVRLLGLGFPSPEAERRAEAYLRKLLLAKKVRLEKDKTEKDEEGGLPRYLYLEDFTFVNAEMIRQGLARALHQEPDTKYRDLFTRLEEEAKKKNRGVWKK
ncbi:MAG: thermonuclease family protein [Nitrospinota bacterium]